MKSGVKTETPRTEAEEKLFGAGGQTWNVAGRPKPIGMASQRRATGMADSTDRA
jgi:hypothetical protein